MLEYISKSLNVTIFDLIVVAIVGGLLVNLFSHFLKWLFKSIRSFYDSKIKEPFKKHQSEKALQKRVRNDDINMRDAWTISKKKGNATEEESKALENFYKREWGKIPQATKEQSARISENIRDRKNRIHKDL